MNPVVLFFALNAVTMAPPDRGPVPVDKMANPDALVRESISVTNGMGCGAIPLTVEHARNMAKQRCARAKYSQVRCGEEVEKFQRLAKQASTFWIRSVAPDAARATLSSWQWQLIAPQGTATGHLALVIDEVGPIPAGSTGAGYHSIGLVQFSQPPAFYGMWQVRCVQPGAVGQNDLYWDFLPAGTVTPGGEGATTVRPDSPAGTPAVGGLQPSCQKLIDLLNVRCRSNAKPDRCHKAVTKSAKRFRKMSEAECARSYQSQVNK